MSRTIAVFWLVVIVTFVFYRGEGSFAFSSEQKDYPDIQFEEKVYNFGVARQQETVSHSYQFKNKGKGILTIKEVKASCGCIATIVSSKEVLPGAIGEIKVTFQTGKYTGKQTKNIFVYSNDPNKQEIGLEIIGMIKTEVALEPESLNFGDVEKGKAVNKIVKIIQLEDEELKLDKVEAAGEYFLTQVSDFKDERNKGFKVNVILKPDAPVGRFTEAITLHTNLKKHPRIDVTVLGNILGRIRVNPQMVSLGSLKKGSYVANKITVESANREEFNILKVTSTLPFLLAKASTTGKNSKFEIVLEINKDAPAGRIEGEIDIYTDEPEQPSIKVPVYGVVKK